MQHICLNFDCQSTLFHSVISGQAGLAESGLRFVFCKQQHGSQNIACSLCYAWVNASDSKVSLSMRVFIKQASCDCRQQQKQGSTFTCKTATFSSRLMMPQLPKQQSQGASQALRTSSQLAAALHSAQVISEDLTALMLQSQASHLCLATCCIQYRSVGILNAATNIFTAIYLC